LKKHHLIVLPILPLRNHIFASLKDQTFTVEEINADLRHYIAGYSDESEHFFSQYEDTFSCY
jgi:hypothetical protein